MGLSEVQDLLHIAWQAVTFQPKTVSDFTDPSPSLCRKSMSPLHINRRGLSLLVFHMGAGVFLIARHHLRSLPLLLHFLDSCLMVLPLLVTRFDMLGFPSSPWLLPTLSVRTLYILNCQQMAMTLPIICFGHFSFPNSDLPLSNEGLYPWPGWIILKVSW